MEDASGFYDATDAAAVEAADGKVTITKSAMADAFLRWSLTGRRDGGIPLDAEHDSVEIDFAAFPEGGMAEVRIGLLDKDNKSHAPVWLADYNTPGKVSLPSVQAFAAENGVVAGGDYHLFLRVASPPPGGFTLEQIRISDGSDAAEPAAAGETLKLIMDQNPVEEGVSFDRKGVEYKPVTIDGRTTPAWAGTGTIPGMGWMRSVGFKVEDPQFREGKRPAVDVEIEYLLDTWGGVSLYADTARGSALVAEGWGGGKKWQTLRATLDDAYFGSRDLGGGADQLDNGGYDLRIVAPNAPLHIRSVRIVGYPLTGDVNWRRLLRLEPIQVDHPAGLLVFKRSESNELRYALRNIAQESANLRYQFTVHRHQGPEVYETSGDFTVKGSTTHRLAFDLDTADWPLGPYRAEFEVFSADGGGPGSGGKAVLSRAIGFGVVSDTKLAKAAEGEFLFGLDAGNPATSDQALAFYDLMGVDILRDPGAGAKPNLGKLLEAVNKLDARGVKTAVMIDPPNQMRQEGPLSDAERQKALDEMTPKIEEVARALKGKVTYYEMGNEPDLPFFYPGTIKDYTDSFEQMADAARRGNPDAVVMNGGLSFHGDEGYPRSREFVQIVDPSKLDAWGYHGHGPGVESERDALRRIRRTVAEFGQPTDKIYFETESGFAAVTEAQEVEQARTAVQKMIYAWSEGSPTLMFFRMFMPEDRWTLVFDNVEPRPAIFAYRNMVEQLRHHRYLGTVDLGSSQAEGYLFEGPEAGRKVLAFWTNDSAPHAATLDLPGAQSPRVIDLYGNASEAETLPGGAITFEATEDPAYLVWKDDTASLAGVQTARPLIDAPQPIRVVSGQTTPVTVSIRNPLDHTVTANLTSKSGEASNLEVSIVGGSFQLDPGQSRQVDVQVRAQAVERIDWPQQWSVFAPVSNEVDLSKFDSIPDTLAGMSPVAAYVQQSTIDLRRFAQGKAEKQRAILMATVDSPADQTVTVGAAADWWMAWFVNGQPVYDTMEEGNEAPYSIDAHTFELPLRKGKNLLAVEVLSGSAGWVLVTGGPEELRRVQQGKGADDQVTLTLALGDAAPVERQVSVEWTQPLPHWSAERWTASLDEIASTSPTLIGGEVNITNRFTSLPDPAMWWGGNDDLSAVVWLAHDEQYLYVVANVLDQNVSTATPDGDSLTLTLADATGGESTRYRVDGDDASASRQGMEARVETGKDSITYHVRIPLPADDSDAVQLALAISDKDGEPGAAKQVLAWPVGAAEESADETSRGDQWMTFHLDKR